MRIEALLGLALALLAPASAAHDDPASTTYDLLVPGDPFNGQITFVTLIGPEPGETVLHTTWDLTFESPPGGTPASEVLLLLELPLEGGSLAWELTGADLGWPAATGRYSGTLGSDQLNGVLAGGLFPFTTPSLDIGATTGGLTGQFQASTITLELAGDVCQTDVGFGGPGAMSLSICGQPLASGATADLLLEGAPSGGLVTFVFGLASAPTPFKGGTLVPLPIALLVPLNANAAGTIGFAVPGGGGPGTLSMQAVAPDASQPLGFALSNALEIELLP